MPMSKEKAAEYRRIRSKRRISEALSFLGGICVQCGTSERLQFDHIDPKTKLFNIVRQVSDFSEEKFWTEVRKCQLLCISHHSAKTNRERENRSGGNPNHDSMGRFTSKS